MHWISCGDEKKLTEFKYRAHSNLTIDHAGDFAYVASSRVNLTMTEERCPEIDFLATRECDIYDQLAFENYFMIGALVSPHRE